MLTIDFIDSHTGGEPTRVVTAGFPDLGGGSVSERLQRLRAQHDRWRRGTILEPRGSDTIVGALLLEPQDLRACAGVIFFNNVGYLGMCGHGTIGLVRTLAYLGRITPGRQQLETPVGMIGVELLADGRVAFENVESYRLSTGNVLNVPGYGQVQGDVAWGGNWFFITHDCPWPIEPSRRRDLAIYTEAIRASLVRDGITGANGAEIDHVEISGPPGRDGVDSRNFVLCPGMAYDRSPCGTGTSAKVACLAADGYLAPGQVWHQAGILGSVFEASYQPAERGVFPRITGRAWIIKQGKLLMEESDPLAWGADAQ